MTVLIASHDRKTIDFLYHFWHQETFPEAPQVMQAPAPIVAADGKLVYSNLPSDFLKLLTRQQVCFEKIVE